MPGHYGGSSSRSSSGSSHDRGGGQHRATATRQVAASRARDRHPTTESTGREQAIANRTYSRPNTVTYGGPKVHGEGLGSQTFNKNLRTIQRRHDYNQGAYERAHPFLSKMGGLGGLLKGIGKAGLSFFGGIPGKALSGIMTASDYAKRKGTGAWEGLQGLGEGVKEFGEHDNLMSYLNRNKVQALQPIETLDIREKFDRTGNVLPDNITNDMGANNQIVDPNFLALGAAEGGRIGYEPGGVVEPGKQYYGKEDWEIQQINQYGVSYPEFLANQGWPPLKQMDATQIAAAADAWKAWRQSQADGGIARLL